MFSKLISILVPTLYVEISLALYSAGKTLLKPIRITWLLRPLPLKLLMRLTVG